MSKRKLDCAALLDVERLKFKSKVVSNDAAGVAQLLHWGCRQFGCEVGELALVMEPTGVYHEQAAQALHTAGAQVSLVNPARVRAHANSLGVRSKTDALDRVQLARYGAQAKPRRWQPAPAEVLELQALLRRLEAIEKDLRRERNRLEKATLASHVPAPIHASLGDSVQFLEQQRRALERHIEQHIDRHPGLRQDRALLESIPGVGQRLAQRMVTVLRAQRFDAASQAGAFLGLAPLAHTSGDTVKRPAHLSKAGDARVRALLYLPAVCACRYNPDVRALYQRLLARGKCKKSAIGAAMRKLVHICFGVLKHQQPYQPQCAPNA